MMRLLVVSGMLFLFACSNRTAVPDGVIPPDSMRKIMKDIVIAEQYSMQVIPKDSTRPDKLKANQELLETIFKIHHTNEKEFKTSLNFYETRPDFEKKIFDSLAADANRRRPELYLPKHELKPVKLPVK